MLRAISSTPRGNCSGASLLAQMCVLVVACLTACEQVGGRNEEPPPAPAAAPFKGGDPEPEPAGDAAMIEDPNVPIPADWQGTGVIEAARREDTRGAPSWTTVEAEVVERDGVRYLLATGVVAGIDNPSLAEKTAENRARHVLARYLNSTRLVNSRIVGTWQDAATGTVYARAEIEVPPTFMPKNLPTPR